jgi:hypothetical protein
MAIIGTALAVARIGTWKVGGLLAWLLWGGVHIAFLVGFRNRWRVLLSWFWGWLVNARDARIITGDARLDVESPHPPGFIRDEAPAAVEEWAGAAGRRTVGRDCGASLRDRGGVGPDRSRGHDPHTDGRLGVG